MSLTDPPLEIGCVEHLLHATGPQRTQDPTGIDSWLYRGQIDGEQPLIASAGRLPCGNGAEPSAGCI